MYDFKQGARDAMGGSFIMKGRDKVSTEFLIQNFPDGITVTEFDIITRSTGESYPVFAYRENPSKYFNGGALAMQIVTEWLKAFDGDKASASNALKESGGVKFKLTTERTAQGRTITRYTVV